MLPETQVIFYSDNVVLIVRVTFQQMLQNLQFYLSLMLEFTFVSDYFQGYNFSCFMIQTLKRLSKRAFA